MNVTSVCRLCLKQSIKMHSLEIEKRGEMIFELTGIKILNDDQSCIKCLIDLKMAHRIQQNFIKNNKSYVTKLFKNNTDQDWHKTTTPNSINTEQCDGDKFKVSDLIDTKTFLDEVIKSRDFDIELDVEESLPDLEDQGEFILMIESKDDETNFVEVSKCDICGLSFNSDLQYYDHVKSHYESELDCEFCGTELQNILAYREHLRSKHKKEELSRWKCELCHRSFQYKALYLIHISTYLHEIKDNTIERFLNQQTIKVETEIAHETVKNKKRGGIKKRDRRTLTKEKKSKKPFEITCECCNKVYTNKSTYQTHKSGSQKKKCPICEAQITAYNLAKHVASHNSMPVVCHICGSTCKNQESLRGHLYYTHSQRQYPCEICGRVFKKKYLYSLHVKTEHLGQKNFVCDTCGKSFFTQYRLNCHLKKTHLKIREHVCVYCHKKFASRFGMKTHERQHTNEAPYVCDLCGEGFRQRVSMRSHQKSKHNIIEKKTVECKECGKMFGGSFALKSHMRLHL